MTNSSSGSMHERRQKAIMDMADFMTLCPCSQGGEHTLKEVIERLASSITYYDKAVTLLFGSYLMGKITEDPRAVALYTHLLSDRQPELLMRLLEVHKWICSPEIPEKGLFSLEIHPGEYFVIDDPVESELLEILISK